MRIILLLIFWSSIEAFAQPPIYNIKNTDVNTGDNFGTSVAVSNNYIAVGSFGTENQTGSLEIYQGAGPDWNLISTHIHSDGNEGDWAGVDVAMTDSHIIVGAPTDHWVDEQTGRAFIYELENGHWQEQSILQPSEDFYRSGFGFIVNMHEDYAVVGAPDYQNEGAVVLYERNGSIWEEKQIFNTPANNLNSFGGSIDISDDWIAIGAYEQDFNNFELGNWLVVYLYQRQGNEWIEKQAIRFEPQNLSYQIPWHGVEFGGEELLISNYRPHSFENIDGESRVFRLEGDVWLESQTIHPEGYKINEIGRHVALSDQFAMIGASFDNPNTPEPHHLLVYNKVDEDNWTLIGDYSFEASSWTSWQGFNLDIDNQYAVAASPRHANEHGDVYVIDLRRFTNNEDLLAEEEINVFPIPSDHDLTVESNGSSISSYMVVNQTGKIMIHKTEVSKYKFDLNIEDYPVGNYWIKVVTDEGYLYRQFSKI